MEKIGINVWCVILQLVDIPTLLAFGRTCQFASKLIVDPANRDTIILRMKTYHTMYEDTARTIVKTSTSLDIPKQIGNIVICNSYSHPVKKYYATIRMGFFKGTSTRFFYGYYGGETDDHALIRVYNDENMKRKQLHLTTSLEEVSCSYKDDHQMCQFVKNGIYLSDQWNVGQLFLQRVLTLAGCATDLPGWIQFADQMKMSSYLAVLFHPQDEELSIILRGAIDLLQWLETVPSY